MSRWSSGLDFALTIRSWARRSSYVGARLVLVRRYIYIERPKRKREWVRNETSIVSVARSPWRMTDRPWLFHAIYLIVSLRSSTFFGPLFCTPLCKRLCKVSPDFPSGKRLYKVAGKAGGWCRIRKSRRFQETGRCIQAFAPLLLLLGEIWKGQGVWMHHQSKVPQIMVKESVRGKSRDELTREKTKRTLELVISLRWILKLKKKF